MKENNKIELTKKYCCGCGLCNNFCKGQINNQGFFRPSEELFKTDFDFSVCYVNQLRKMVNSKFWGEYQSIYYSWSNDNDIRKRASSGGTLTQISQFLIENNIVDYVVQIKQNRNSLIKTEVVYSNSDDEIKMCSGSRYTSSASLINLLNNLDFKKKYAVIGKPCDIKVLRSYLDINPELQKNIVYLFTFFCGGTPSYDSNKKLLKSMNLCEDSLQYFSYRGNGWPGKTTGISNDGVKSEMEYEESWGEILGRELQPICRFCWDGVGSAADISCGDGWYVENDRPSFAEQEGRNIIFSRTDKGEELLKMLIDCNKLHVEEVTDKSILNKMQPGQFMRKTAMFSRVFAMKVMNVSVPKYNLFSLLPFAFKISPIVNIKMFGGTVKRIKNGKIK